VHKKNALGLLATPRGWPRPRLPLGLAVLLGACVYIPAAPPGGASSAPPVPEVVRRHPWTADTRWPGGLARPPERDQLQIAAEIEQLLTGDFDVYPVAAHRLIARGDAVLPYVGQASERHPAPAARRERLDVVLGPVLRDATEERVLVALSSAYPAVRAAAAAAVGERRLSSLGPRLVSLLEDKDIRVRRAAITSLRMLTGEFLEYRPDDPPAARAAAADRWDELWQRRQ
jgi:hypothetical protein